MTAQLDERLDRLRHAVEAELSAAVGDESLCVIAKSGRSYSAVKYHEGRAAAVAMVRRALREYGDELTALASTREHFDGMADLAGNSRDWEAYRQGGFDALDKLEAGG